MTVQYTEPTKAMRVVSSYDDLSSKDKHLCDDLLSHISHLIQKRKPSKEELRHALWSKIFERWNSTNVGTMRPVLLDPLKGLLTQMPYRDLPLGYLKTVDTMPFNPFDPTINPPKRHEEVTLRVIVRSDTGIDFVWIDAQGNVVEANQVELGNKQTTLREAQAVACKHYDFVHMQKVNDHNMYLAMWMGRHRLASSLLKEYEASHGEDCMSEWDKIFNEKAGEAEFLEFQQQPKLCRDVLDNMSELKDLYDNSRLGYPVGRL